MDVSHDLGEAFVRPSTTRHTVIQGADSAAKRRSSQQFVRFPKREPELRADARATSNQDWPAAMVNRPLPVSFVCAVSFYEDFMAPELV